MPINDKINRDHDTSWLKLDKKQDVPDSTHKLVSVNNTFKMMKKTVTNLFKLVLVKNTKKILIKPKKVI